MEDFHTVRGVVTAGPGGGHRPRPNLPAFFFSGAAPAADNIVACGRSLGPPTLDSASEGVGFNRRREG